MRSTFIILGILAVTNAAFADKPDPAWRMAKAPKAREYSLIYGDPASGLPAYLFQCTGPDKILVAQYSTLPLRDFNTGHIVSNDVDESLNDGIVFMGLATDVAQTKLIPAKGVRSQYGSGWDIAIHLDRSDPAFMSLPNAERISLVTSGYTMAVRLEPEDRVKIRQFVEKCGALVPPAKGIVSKKESPGITRAGAKSVSYGG